jgi:hypothetical protein
MRRAWLWGFGLTVIFSLGITAVRADDDDEKPAGPAKTTYGRGPGLMDRLFKSSEKPTTKKPGKKDAESPAKEKADKPEKPAVDSAGAIRAREQAALERRMQVCLRLMDLANQQNDEELYRRAEELDKKAWAVYRQRTAHLPGGNAAESDEEVLDRHLGNKSAAAPNAGSLTSGTAKAKDRNSQAAVREVKP